MNKQPPVVWSVVPAAGMGRRFGGAIPKQYATLLGKPMARWSIERLLSVKRIAGCVVAIHPADHRWQQLHFDDPRLVTVSGGAERADSVRLALAQLSPRAAAHDWVLVHDIARPCVRSDDIENLIQHLFDHAVGGVLAAPVADTIKRVSGNHIVATEDRSHLWRALTPQMFRFGLLQKALRHCVDMGAVPTDEAAAVEALGYRPVAVEGRRDNIKVTQADDLVIAEAILTVQENTR